MGKFGGLASMRPHGLRGRGAWVVWLVALLISLPVGIGIAGVALPAAGFLPALGGVGLSAEPFVALVAEPGLGDSIALSLTAGLATTAVSVAGVALFVAAFLETRLFALARLALAPLLAVPHAAAAFGLAFLIAPSGLLFRALAAPLGIDRPPDLLIVGDPLGLTMMAGLLAKEMPFLLLVTIAALPQAAPMHRLRIARSFGYGRIAGFLLGVWPGVYRQIRLPVLAVVAYASSVVDVAIILGPSTPPPLAVRVLEWMQDPDLSQRFKASAGAMLQLATTAVAIATWIGLETMSRFAVRRLGEGGRRHAADRAVRIVAAAPMSAAGIAVLAGIVMLALWSVAGFWAFPDLMPGSFGLDLWRRALASASTPLAASLALALLSSAAAIVLVVALLEARRVSHRARAGVRLRLQPAIAGLLYLPLIVPQISFVFGLQVLALNLGTQPSVWLVAAAHLIFVVPYVALALADPWYALDPRFEQMAASLGHSPWAAFWRVRLPLLGGALAIAFAIGFAVSVGQYLPTLLIGAGKLPTITTEAVALASGANPRVIGVYALLQAALPLLVFGVAVAFDRLRRQQRSGTGRQ